MEALGDHHNAGWRNEEGCTVFVVVKSNSLSRRDADMLIDDTPSELGASLYVDTVEENRPFNFGAIVDAGLWKEDRMIDPSSTYHGSTSKNRVQ